MPQILTAPPRSTAIIELMQGVDRGAQLYEAQHRQLQIKHLKWKAAKLGFKVIQVPAA